MVCVASHKSPQKGAGLWLQILHHKVVMLRSYRKSAVSLPTDQAVVFRAQIPISATNTSFGGNSFLSVSSWADRVVRGRSRVSSFCPWALKHGPFSREAKAERSRVRAAILAVRHLRDSI